VREYRHRERVVTSLNHTEPDRVPRDLGGRVSSMMEGAYRSLKKYLDLDECGYDTVNQDYFTVEEFDERVLEYFDIDLRRVFLRGSGEYQKISRKTVPGSMRWALSGDFPGCTANRSTIL